MASHGPYSNTQLKFKAFEGDYCYYANPDRVRVHIHTGELEVQSVQGASKGDWYNPSLSRGRLTFKGKSFSVARLIYMAFHPQDLNNKMPVQFKDCDSSNLSPDNLYLGPMVGKSRKLGMYDPEWTALVAKVLPNPKDRNVKNKVYMKLLNSKKGPDGLDHSQRYYQRKKAAGLKLRLNPESGKREWIPRNSKLQSTTPVVEE